jgi:hypothetical protein
VTLVSNSGGNLRVLRSFDSLSVKRLSWSAEVPLKKFESPIFLFEKSLGGIQGSCFVGSLAHHHTDNMPSLVAARTSNTQWKPLYRPVGVFLGGTSGIGQAMAERLAAQTGGRVHIILLGRNKDAAERIISGFPRHEESVYEFEPIDATSMKDVRRATRALLGRLDKANFIVASAGFLTTKGRDETDEGLDKKLACNIYSRFRFALDLLPLLEKAADAGEDAKFMTILAAGQEPTSYLNLDDLGLKKEYSLANAGAVASHYSDALVEVCVSFLSTAISIDQYPSPGARTEVSEGLLHTYLSRSRLDANGHKLPLVHQISGATGALRTDEPCRLCRVDVELALEQRSTVQDGCP